MILHTELSSEFLVLAESLSTSQRDLALHEEKLLGKLGDSVRQLLSHHKLLKLHYRAEKELAITNNTLTRDEINDQQ